NTNSTAGIASGGHQNTHGGGIDAFLVKFDGSGVRQWATYYGGSGSDYGLSCAADGSGNVYLAGYAASSSTGIASGGHQNTHGGGSNDAYLAKFCAEALGQLSAITGNTFVCSSFSQSYSISTVPTATAYLWSLPSGWSGTSGTNSITVIPGASGILSVSATNACGASPIQTISIVANPVPTITVNSGSICAGQSFTMLASGASTYIFSGGSDIVSPVTNTTYLVLGISVAGCISTVPAIATVSVNPLPIITVNSGSICAGDNFTITPSGATTYTISGGNFTVTPNTNISYSVTGTDLNGCVSTEAVTEITVHALPTVSVNSGSICAGDNFTIMPSGANTYSITGNNFTVNPNATSLYSVTGTDLNGCISTEAVTEITVHALPTVSVNSGAICFGDNFVITPSGANTYTISGGNFTVTPNTNISYSVTGTDLNGCVSTEAVSEITVHALPTLSVTGGGTICVNESANLIVSGADTYTWSTNENNASITVSPSTNTAYSVQGTDNNGCQNDANVTVNVDECLGIGELGIKDEELKIYPNPVGSVLNVESPLSPKGGTVEISIYDVLGKVIKNEKLKIENGAAQINVSQIPKGIYFIKAEADNYPHMQSKFVKE
ncbi:MAG: T9SS type A sorting domain-containing protein, partial [Bacteroidetes bacterium]|nr:T9SS type A sorting domain-containing protein [Bacteroidota bacterium]